MDRETKNTAWKQYLRYFRVWFVITGALLAVFLMVFMVNSAKREDVPRGNHSAPAERVYDFADVLTDGEEAELRRLISLSEAKIQCDIVLVTVREKLETDTVSWETGMRDYADDFYDNSGYGYDKVHGNGALLLDNWQESQKGSWLSTCGSVYGEFGDKDVRDVLDAVDREVETSPFRAYRAYIREVTRKMARQGSFSFPPVLILIIPLAAFGGFVLVKSRSPLGKDTAAADAYVAEGSTQMKEKRDQFVRKFITTRRIPRADSGSGGGGGGGGHVSGGGVSHGGGGSRR